METWMCANFTAAGGNLGLKSQTPSPRIERLGCWTVNPKTKRNQNWAKCKWKCNLLAASGFWCAARWRLFIYFFLGYQLSVLASTHTHRHVTDTTTPHDADLICCNLYCNCSNWVHPIITKRRDAVIGIRKKKHFAKQQLTAWWESDCGGEELVCLWWVYCRGELPWFGKKQWHIIGCFHFA